MRLRARPPVPTARRCAAALPRASRRERHRAEIRERLFHAALRLFAERGYLETTVEDITDAADVGKGTFFNYFPTKEHVLATYGDERVAIIQRALAQARANKGPVLPVIRALSVGLVGQSRACPALLRSIHAANASCASVREDLQVRLRAARRLLTEIFVLAQKRGEIRQDIPASELARLTQLVFNGTIMAWAMNPDSSLRKTTDELWGLMSLSLHPKDARGHRKLSRA